MKITAWRMKDHMPHASTRQLSVQAYFVRPGFLPKMGIEIFYGNGAGRDEGPGRRAATRLDGENAKTASVPENHDADSRTNAKGGRLATFVVQRIMWSRS